MLLLLYVCSTYRAYSVTQDVSRGWGAQIPAGRKVAVVTEFRQGGRLFVAPVWNLFHVTLLAPTFLRTDMSFFLFCLLFCLYVFGAGFLNIDPMIIAVLVN